MLGISSPGFRLSFLAERLLLCAHARVHQTFPKSLQFMMLVARCARYRLLGVFVTSRNTEGLAALLRGHSHTIILQRIVLRRPYVLQVCIIYMRDPAPFIWPGIKSV